MERTDESAALLERIEEELLKTRDPARRAALKEWRRDVLRQQAEAASTSPPPPQAPTPPRPATKAPTPHYAPPETPRVTVRPTVQPMTPAPELVEDEDAPPLLQTITPTVTPAFSEAALFSGAAFGEE